jgi:Fe-S cluster assembly protein SufD
MTLAAIMPKPKEERWKYTDLAGAVRKLAIGDTPVAPPVAPVVIDVPAGHVATEPFRISISGIDGYVSEPALAIRLGENAQATVIEIHTGGGKFLNNAATHIILDKGAHLKHFRVQAYDASGVYVQNTQVSLARDALYDTFTLTTGAALSRNEIYARLEGPGAHCELNGVNLLRGTQHGDTTITVDHSAPNCTSHQFYRSVLDNQARGVFQGKIYVARDAQKTDGFQMSRALLLSEGAEMDTKPELEIYADDVKCSHGATTGQLDEEALFYMRSRGIGMAEARGLLIGAFVNEAVDKIEDETVRGEFAERVRSWLGN